MDDFVVRQYVEEFVRAVGRPVIEKLEIETNQPIAVTVAVIESGRLAAAASIPAG